MIRAQMYKTVTVGIDEGHYACRKCGREYDARQDVINHFELSHEVDRDDVILVYCEDCGMKKIIEPPSGSQIQLALDRAHDIIDEHDAADNGCRDMGFK